MAMAPPVPAALSPVAIGGYSAGSRRFAERIGCFPLQAPVPTSHDQSFATAPVLPVAIARAAAAAIACTLVARRDSRPFSGRSPRPGLRPFRPPDSSVGRFSKLRFAAGKDDTTGVPQVQLGHDGSPEAAQYLEALQSRGLLGPGCELLSPLGVPSSLADVNQTGEALGRVFALLPGGRLLAGIDAKSWTLDPPCIGTGHEWTMWDYYMSLLGDRWWDAYAWEYWRFLRPASPERRGALYGPGGVEGGALAPRPSSCSQESEWWAVDGTADVVASMLAQHGFCVLDDFLPHDVAAAVASSAKAAWRSGCMASGMLSTGGRFARGDSVLWVNTQDPASAAAAGGAAPQEGQASAAAPELKPVLESIDRLVGDVLAPRLDCDSRLRRVRTRSHAMFTCYPASSPEVMESPGAEGASQSSSSTQSVMQGPVLGSGNGFSRGYLRHLDNVRHLDGGQDCGRVLTTILYLNEDWQESHGGALRLFETSTSLQVRAEVLPRLNRLIAFWADEVPHEVLPPRGRDRFACTFWYGHREADPASVAFEKAPAAAAMAGAGSMFLD
ncbi:unnamed protein product [Polarella glacialis]|uniref:Fe2OG dioxygenase domain-containing protein n=1 Tax=Polarella glacialis TaxID=89957 RepID=A0A813FIY4_POLGL|nr:unnamed protein product [Polarella glacialis]